MQEVLLILMLTGGGNNITMKSVLPEGDYVDSKITVKRAMQECHKLGKTILKMKKNKRATLSYKCVSFVY